MKVFAASLLVTMAFAIESKDVSNGHYKMNEHYDHSDHQHHHYGSENAASPAYPTVPKFNDAVDAFDTYGTLFGEHRYQLQVMKTGNMLIGTEALRESIAALKDRVYHARHFIDENDREIHANDQDIDDNRLQIEQNRKRLVGIDGKLHDLESGYEELHHKLAIDREALIMMCHQYAYASTVPDECGPIIGGLSQPIQYQWNWPDKPCPGQPALPPFEHKLPHYESAIPHKAPAPQK